MNPLIAFVNWYTRNIEKSILITLGILLLQIPHFLWGGDVILQSGMIAGANPVSDFVLYSIDLLEIPLIVKTAADFIILKRK